MILLISKTTIDSDSDYERVIQNTEPSTPTERFSIESLIKQVDKYQRKNHIETIEINNREFFASVFYYEILEELVFGDRNPRKDPYSSLDITKSIGVLY